MNRNVRLINLYTVFTNMVFILPVVVPYYHSIGLTFQQFLIGEAVFSAVVILAEVPTGWVSDIWQRKYALMLGMSFGILGFLLLLAGNGFWLVTAAQGIIGLAVAMNSGSVTSLLYDSLAEEENGAAEYRRLEGARHAISLFSVAFAAIVGGYLFSVHPKLPLLMDMLAIACGILAISRVQEPARHKQEVRRHPLRDMAETARYALRGHPDVGGIILLSAVIFAATKLLLWAQQPYYQSVGIPVAWYGVIMAVNYVISGLAGHQSHRFEHLMGNRAALAVMGGFIILSSLLLAAFPAAPMIALFLTGTCTYAMGMPRVQNAINQRVGSERRATILSTANLLVHVLFIPTSLVMGWLTDHGSVREGLVYVAGQIALLGAIGLWLWKKPVTDPVPA